LKIHKLGYYIGHILFGLLIAQFLEKHSNFVIAVALIIIMIHSIIIFYYLKDHFLFVSYLFSLCSIYTFDIFGGITFVPFVILLSYIGAPGKFVIKNVFVRSCLFIIIITTFLGYLFVNENDLRTIIQSGIIFSGIILTFIFVQNLKVAKFHITISLKIVTLLSILLLFVAVNQKIILLDSSLPIFGAVAYPTVRSLSIAFSFSRFPSLFCDYELYAEFSLLMLIIAYSIIMDKRAIDYYSFGIYPYILLFSSFLGIILSGTRSGFLLAIVFIIIFSLFRFNLLFTESIKRLILIVILILPILLIFGDKIGFGYLMDRFSEININFIGIESLRTGEEINRKQVYDLGYARLAQDNWLLGFGFGRGVGNEKAWFGVNFMQQTGRINPLDFHSLYLCFPMIYGWIGGMTYLILIVYIIVLLFRKYFFFKDHPLGGIASGFAFMFMFFLIDQIKINSLRYYNYHFLIWILMGVALSIVNTKIKDEGSVVN
jgi:hypothetical protein